jgi:hypothetical protein
MATTSTGNARLVADAAFDFSSLSPLRAAPARADEVSAGSPVLTLNLQEVWQAEASHSTDSLGVTSALAGAAAASYGGVAPWLPDAYTWP